MVKYKCPKCGMTSNTPYCYDCGRDLPMSCRIVEDEQNNNSNIIKTEKGIRYRCPYCGATCRTDHCYDCDKDIPRTSTGIRAAVSKEKPVNQNDNYYDTKVGNYIRVDNYNKRFKITGDKEWYSFSNLVNYELYENNSVMQKGGVGRAVVGGVLFGGVGAIVGAQTRKSQNIVDSLYIRLTLKSTGMRKIVFINTKTDRDGIFYSMERKNADKVISELDLIMAKNQEVTQPVLQVQTQPDSPTPPPAQTEQQVVSVADELLKLKQLLDMGVLTDEEFNQQKQKLLNR